MPKPKLKPKERWDFARWEEALGTDPLSAIAHGMMGELNDGEMARHCLFARSWPPVASVVLARTIYRPATTEHWLKSILSPIAMRSMDQWPNQPTGEYAMGALLGSFESIAWLRRFGLPGTWDHNSANYLANALDQLAQHVIWLLDNSQLPDYWVNRETNILFPDERWEGRLANAVPACWCGLTASTLTFIFSSMFGGESEEEQAAFSLREAKLAGAIGDRLSALAIWQANDPADRMRAAWATLFQGK